MFKYALFSYFPRRYQHRASFEQQELCRMILGFKDGRNIYTCWAVREVSKALALANLQDVVVVCIPASTHYAHVRRWKRFSRLLCKHAGAIDGFDRVQVCCSRKRAHVTGEYDLANDIRHYVHVDIEYFQGKKVLVVDDIYTTGQSSSAFIGAMEAAGASVVGAVFLAKTRQFRCQQA